MDYFLGKLGEIERKGEKQACERVIHMRSCNKNDNSTLVGNYYGGATYASIEW
jgi:hypothetical protein